MGFFNATCGVAAVIGLVVASKHVPTRRQHEQELRKWVTENIAAAETKTASESFAKFTAAMINAEYVNDPESNYLDFFGFDYNTYGVLSLSKGKGSIVLIGAFDHVWTVDLSSSTDKKNG